MRAIAGNMAAGSAIRQASRRLPSGNGDPPEGLGLNAARRVDEFAAIRGPRNAGHGGVALIGNPHRLPFRPQIPREPQHIELKNVLSYLPGECQRRPSGEIDGERSSQSRLDPAGRVVNGRQPATLAGFDRDRPDAPEARRVNPARKASHFPSGVQDSPRRLSSQPACAPARQGARST